MELITPGLGLVVWMGISFGLVLLILRKYAWKPILATIRARERAIVRSLVNARHVEEEMQRVEVLKRERLEEAERIYGQMLERARAEAKEVVDKAVAEARQEAAKLLGETEKIIEVHKRQAMLEIRDQIAGLSLEMAERVLQEEFSDKDRNTRFVNQLLDQMILN
jgi:F-type H+-transporting ATPase subunit b